MTLSLPALEKALLDFLPRQRWVSGDADAISDVTVARADTMVDGLPGLVHVLADVRHADGTAARYQVMVGMRPAGEDLDFLHGKDHLVLGELETDDGPALAYEAMVDAELALAVLRAVAPGQEAKLVRALNVEQSNTSVVYDDRLIMKVFRRIAEGPNPDAEVTRALAAVGFENVATPVASWHEDGTDYVVVNEYLTGAIEGWQLALTSLRDLYAARTDPDLAGGNFAPEARRLGEVTARLHLAMAEAFGSHPGDSGAWASDMELQLQRLPAPEIDRDRVRAVYERMAGLEQPGRALRVHGDYHLAQVMRTDSGWYVLDFEGEPARPLEERRRPSSPLRDVAGMLRSFHYASHVALREREEQEDEELQALAAAWERVNREAFLEGYATTPGIDALLPPEGEAVAVVLGAFELDKAVYEVAYEVAHRPTWVRIPLQATERILEALS